MNINLTDITVVLDRSGSMSSVKTDTIGGFNEFVLNQRKDPDEARLTLVQFDDQYEVNYTARDIQSAPLLDDKTFAPRGSTALLDAIGKTLVSTGERLSKMPEAERPGKIVFVILTDGDENASKEYSKTKIDEMIRHQSEVYNWNFVFLGANQDAIKTGASLGILAGNAMSYAANGAGTRSAFDAVSASVTLYKSAGSAKIDTFFTDAQRDAQKQAGA